MRKFEKKQIEDFVALLSQVHDEIRKSAENKDYTKAMELLTQCQEGAVAAGELIEKTEGQEFPTIVRLEEYCETVYELYVSFASDCEISANKIYKRLKKSLIQIENSVRNDIKARPEMVFLPYKASMWDSLESVWQAAEADPECDAYVVPIPYYDRRPDGSLGTYHYEGNDLPACVPVINYETYCLEDRNPDAIFIHNPYDHMNHVTSIDPRFYSNELKKHTSNLVYIPYYATSGGMSEGQKLCPAYLNVDYIVIQAEKFRKYFDESIPDKKFLVFGSPKFDSVIHKCQNPPEPLPEWKEKMKGRKVYFYNTSINGMLGNTDAFLKKMRYVFSLFQGREDVCLLWRPHPLLESTFDSMRKEFRPAYDVLKREFVRTKTGILDETPDIENTIALCDAYIGDAGTSVTSLFGVAGKPMFILNNYIHTLPEKDDWRGERVALQFNGWGDDRYQVTNNNQLWFSEKNDYHYKFYMDLGTGYSGSRYYMRAMEIRGKVYVIPCNAQNLLIIEDKKIRKIEFPKYTIQGAAFQSCFRDDGYKYLYLFPNQYPKVIRFHLDTEKVDSIDGIQPFYVRNTDQEWKSGGIGLYGNELMFASPEDGQILFMDMDTLKTRMCSVPIKKSTGIQGFALDGEDLWLMPVKGLSVTRWNPRTGETREYSGVPGNFQVKKWPYEYECEEHPFGGPSFFREGGREEMILSPNWGNMYLSLDRKTGRMQEWKLPVGSENRGKNGYFLAGGMGSFVITEEQDGKPDCRVWYVPERRLYDINVFTKEYKEVEVAFDYDDLIQHEPGFSEESEWLQYCLMENALNSLKDFLDGRITGAPFDRERQLQAFSNVNADTAGTSGQRIYEFVKERIS